MLVFRPLIMSGMYSVHRVSRRKIIFCGSTGPWRICLSLSTKQVGLANTLIVLSADHGGPDAPGYLNSLNIPAGYIEPETWDREAAINRIKDRFNIEGQLIEKYAHPYVYFSADVIDNEESTAKLWKAAVVEELSKFPGVSVAVSSTALRRGNVPDTQLYRSVLNNFHAKRSGDIYIVFEPNWFINDFDGLVVAATHGSPLAV